MAYGCLKHGPSLLNVYQESPWLWSFGLNVCDAPFQRLESQLLPRDGTRWGPKGPGPLVLRKKKKNIYIYIYRQFITILYLGPSFKNFGPLPLQFYINFIAIAFVLVVK